MRQNFKKIGDIIKGIDNQTIKDGDKIMCVGEVHVACRINLNSEGKKALWLKSDGVIEVRCDKTFVVRDYDKVWVRGTLRCVEFYGWFIDAEYIQRNKF